jgi:hypothetical protein
LRAMLFNDLLAEENIDPAGVLVLRHTPRAEDGKLREVLPLLADAKPDVFNAYQQTQTPKVEADMLRAQHVASFIGLEKPKGRAEHTAVFVGLYKVGDHRPLTYEQFWQVPAYQELKKFGMRGFVEGERAFVLWFDLTITDFYKKWQGKLVIEWPPPPLRWWRWAKPNKFPIYSIREDSLLHEAMPEWNKCILSWAKFSIIPISWREKLSGWRGIYYIYDESDRKGYVGSAYGEENIYGRWTFHVARGGDSVLLRDRSPRNFTFSILELVSPNMQKDDVTALETTWKDRLHTRAPLGLNEN